MASVHHPKLLFLDELSTGHDPQKRAYLWDHVRALRDRGTTIFLTTHHLEQADAGEIVIAGTPRDLKHQVGGDQLRLYQVLRFCDTKDA